MGAGWSWFVIVATFFVLGVAFTWYRYEYKQSIGSAQEKGGTRNWPNILANGGIASLFGLGEFLGGGLLFAALYVGAVSAAASDTVATELGLLNKVPAAPHHRPEKGSLSRHLGRRQRDGVRRDAPRLGSHRGGRGACWEWRADCSPCSSSPSRSREGSIGSIADSVAGATIQRKSFCVVCGKPSENLVHCGEPTRFSSGLKFVDNHVVNVLATVFGALGSVGLYLFFAEVPRLSDVGLEPLCRARRS